MALRPSGRWLFALAVVAACNLGDHPVPDGGPVDNVPSAACSGICHGSGGVAAPPRDVGMHSDTASIGVGAHRAHLNSSTWHKRIECATCHKVPQEIGEAGHIDASPAEVTQTGVGAGGVWDRNTATCSNTYCHGATLTNSIGLGMTGSAGGTATEPVWTIVDGSQSACGSCHGAPPPDPHPPGNDCGACHPTMNPGAGMVIAYPELHIDGHLDVVNTAACDSCHGANGQSAPPVDMSGGTATTLKGVGAHAAHVKGSSPWHAPLNCNECHKIPAGINDQGHVDTPLPAEIVWGPLAGAGGAWNAAAATCSNTYCHSLAGVLPPNQASAGGSAMTPLWTRVDGQQSTCGSCHGNPPPSPHPNDNNCGSCHPTMTGGGVNIAYPALHIDGTVDVINDQPCDFCHGSNGIAAPPKDTTGGMTTDLRTVGAHRNHLNASAWRKDIACTDCHKVPTALYAVGHVDTVRPAELTFSVLAGLSVWNGNTCSNNYCHGSTLGGGTSKNPVWTTVNGLQGQCGSCHGEPPPAPHPADPDCGTCHNTMTAGGGLVITDPTRHIDGNLDVTGDLACNSCHGSTNNAPPKDTQNNTATNTRGVGSHQSHLATTNRFKPVACTDCHRVPGAMNSVGHIDTPLPAELTFSALAGTGTAWNGSRCSNNYCHGRSLTGGTATAPIWTTLDGTYRACTACHGNPPTSAPHTPADTNCGPVCHDDMSNGTTFSAPLRHVDGNVDANANLACNGVCHGTTNNAPPTDTGGNSATTTRGVGAHQVHVAPTGTVWHKAVTCDQCHRVPATVNATGHRDTALPAELTFTGIAVPSVWNGANCTSYCHGSTLAAGGNATTPVWTTVTGSQSQCNSCHGNPPPSHSGYANNTQCTNCHQNGGTGGTFTNAAQHIDGTLQVTAVHPPGYDAREMHGYDFDKMGPSTCATSNCHGTALTGGQTGPTCVTCHANAGSPNWQTKCSFCHGTTANGAPPQGVLGQTARTDKHVGAHTSHVTAGAMAPAFACSFCHTNPSSAVTPGHVDGTGAVVAAEVRYSSLNPSGTYATATATCSNLWCHGNGRTSAGTETWTSTTPMTCTSCHNAPAPGQPATGMTPEHDRHIRDKKLKCIECHQTVVNATPTIIDITKHVNGTKEIKMINGTWTPATKTCSALPCHGTEQW